MACDTEKKELGRQSWFLGNLVDSVKFMFQHQDLGREIESVSEDDLTTENIHEFLQRSDFQHYLQQNPHFLKRLDLEALRLHYTTVRIFLNIKIVSCNLLSYQLPKILCAYDDELQALSNTKVIGKVFTSVSLTLVWARIVESGSIGLKQPLFSLWLAYPNTIYVFMRMTKLFVYLNRWSSGKILHITVGSPRQLLFLFLTKLISLDAK